MKKWVKSFFDKITNLFDSNTDNSSSSDEGKKQQRINKRNLDIAIISVMIAFASLCVAKCQFDEERKNIAISQNQVYAQIEISKKEYSLAIKQFQSQRNKDSIQSLEDEKKFQENLKLSQGQIKALRAITDYNLAAQKPFFQSEFKIGFIEDKEKNKHMMLYTGLKNAGNRPSTNLWIYLTLIDRGYNAIIREIEFSSQNGVSPNEDYQHGENIDFINGNSFYLYALICYNDPILDKQIQQKFYYMWANETQNELESANWVDVEAIDLFIKKNNNVPYCCH